jgi:hypothetical protein
VETPMAKPIRIQVGVDTYELIDLALAIGADDSFIKTKKKV